ncbi:MAG: proton-conducting transporter membrane subunit [Pseudomonadota bacterium]
MDHSFVFKYIYVLTIFIGSANIVIPFITPSNSLKQLVPMLLVATFYIASIVILGIFYIQVGETSFVLLDLGRLKLKFHLEPIGLIFLSLLGLLWYISIIYSYGYFKYLEYSQRVAQSLISACIVMSSLISMSGNILTTFIFYEILTICTAPLIYNKCYRSLEKYLRPLLYPSLLLFLPSAIYITFAENISQNEAIILSVLCIFGVSKAAIVPFHTWLPAAMVAMHPVSALLHAVAIVNTGVFVICKLFFYEIKPDISINTWLLFIPTVTILYGGIKAINSTSIKQLLAYSTINQLSICLLGVFLLSKEGVKATIICILAHSLAKISLFFIAGNIYLFQKTSELKDLRGLIYLMPGSVILFILASLSLIGTPFVAGGIGKDALISAAHSANNIPAVVMIVIGSIMTGIYLSKVVYIFCNKTELSTESTKWWIRLRFTIKEELQSARYMLLFLPIIICNLMAYGFHLVVGPLWKLMSFL